MAQYADDIAIWVNTTLRKHTTKRVVNHVQKLYQLEINKLTAYSSSSLFIVIVFVVAVIVSSKYPDWES